MAGGRIFHKLAEFRAVMIASESCCSSLSGCLASPALSNTLQPIHRVEIRRADPRVKELLELNASVLAPTRDASLKTPPRPGRIRPGITSL